jgi:enoyl-CoA hydratase
VVSLVNGTAVAGGLELIVSSDFAYASSEARIGDAHVRFGQMGGGGVLTMAPRVLGSARARELIFSGRLLDAETAKSWGIVSEVFAPDQLVAKGVEFANHVAKWSPLAIANTKFVMSEAVEQGLGATAHMRLELERAALFTLTSEDSAEGLVAFSEKREPKYTGR